MSEEIRPTYYVAHPDGSYSVADPQPLADRQARIAPVATLYHLYPEGHKTVWHVPRETLDHGAKLYTAPAPSAELLAPKMLCVATVDPPNPSVLWNGDLIKRLPREHDDKGKMLSIKLYVIDAAVAAQEGK